MNGIRFGHKFFVALGIVNKSDQDGQSDIFLSNEMPFCCDNFFLFIQLTLTTALSKEERQQSLITFLLQGIASFDDIYINIFANKWHKSDFIPKKHDTPLMLNFSLVRISHTHTH